MEAEDPEGLAKLEPGGMIYVGDHQPLLYIEDFLSFSSYKSIPAIDPHVQDKISPKGLDWQGLCREPLDILNIYAITLWFQRRYFYVFPIISLWRVW